MAAKRRAPIDDEDYDEDDYYDEEDYDEDEVEDEGEDDGSQRSSVFTSLPDASQRRAVLVPLILVLFGFGAWLMWKRYGDQVLAGDSFRFDPYKIHYTDPPKSLASRNILEEVVQIGSLDAVELHQPELVLQVVNAFELHPWVKRVVRVRKRYPPKMSVEVSYRSAVAMVALPPRKGRYFLQPIDEEAVILPDEDFNGEQARNYPRIDLGRGCQGIPDGAGWGDPVVIDAARIAKLLYHDWEELGEVLYEIRLGTQPLSASSSADFDIRGRPGTPHEGLLFHWGRAPGNEQVGEPNAESKLANLRRWVTDAKLATHPVRREIDLRKTFSGVRTGEKPAPVPSTELH